MTRSKKVEIIATGITTLDEARYFAAMGTDWIGFDAQKLSVEEIKTVANWVVGPKMFVEMKLMQEEFLFEISNKIHLHSLCLPLEGIVPIWYDGHVIKRSQYPILVDQLNQQSNTTLMLRLDQAPIAQDALTELHRICMSNVCWIEVVAIESLRYVCKNIPMKGIVIRCIEQGQQNDDVFAQYDKYFEVIETMLEI